MVLFIFISVFITNSMITIDSNQHAALIWKKISTYFEVPVEYTNKFGEYRSPLKFYDGRTVKNSEEWKERRREILHRWHQLMGQWPPLNKNPKVEIIETKYRENFTQQHIKFPWTPNEQTKGYLLLPEGKGKKPAVVTVYYEPETAIGLGKPFRDFAYQLTKRGFITLSLGTAEATEAKTYALYYPTLDNAQVQPLSMLAYAAANAWYLLANRADVDSNRIGIVGHSFGGKWAMFASCLFNRFVCAAWSDPGIVFDQSRPNVNYWEPWYLGYHRPPWRKRGIITEENPARGLYPKLVSEGHDLHELHTLMAPRPFFVSGGSEDPPERWLSLNHAVAVNQLLGYPTRVAYTHRPNHTPTVKSNEQIYQFFEYFLMYNGIM
jgi:dienelactone hydrolase